MKDIEPFNLSARWTRAGAMFNCDSSSDSPDLEMLLLDTVRGTSRNSRLFIMAASWLALYGDLISDRRLANLIQTQLEPEFIPVIGLLLDNARESSRMDWFANAISACKPSSHAHALFAAEDKNPTLRAIAEKNATPMSKKWNLFARPFELKLDAIRPRNWIERANPTYRHHHLAAAV